MNARLYINPPLSVDPKSMLETSYPHIVDGLLKVWNSPEATKHYLNSVLVDDRDDRKGLPEHVFEELMYLADLNWKRTHFNADGVQITAGEFSFGNR
jgi:hypothetical protein